MLFEQKVIFFLLFQLITFILLHRWLYWSNRLKDKIEKAHLLLFQLITFILSHRWLYWSDVYTNKIEKARLDGSQREALVTTGLSWPEGLALDQQSKWINKYLNRY